MSTDNLGYKNNFLKAEELLKSKNQEELFNNFRVSPGPYKFVLAEKSKRPDYEALEITKTLDETIFNQYIEIKKPLVGYRSIENFCEMDHLDSRHIMMSTIIQKELGSNFKNIVEIGGGFGNWFRLNENVWSFDSWNIIDLEFVIELQKWYINNTCNNLDKINYINFKDLNKFNIEDIDLVIASHSLSELDISSFETYVSSILNKTSYLFYATHLYAPSKELVDKKLEILNRFFYPIKEIKHIQNKVTNILFKAKK